MGADFQLVSDDDEALWERGEVTLTFPGIGTFDVLDRANPIMETDSFNPETRPVTYMVESLVCQMYDDHRKKLRKALVKGIEDGTVMVRSITKALRWIGEQREEYEERAVSRQTGRPTSGQQHSTP
jgi:hypothetical protein